MRLGLAHLREFSPVVEEGFASSLSEAAIRFSASHEAIATILVGMATVDEFERALAAIERGPLSLDGLTRIAELQRRFAGTC